MDEKENTKQTNIVIETDYDGLDYYNNIRGYQVTQSVIAITEEDHRQTIIPLARIQSIRVTVKE